jgi:hypothetical protein
MRKLGSGATPAGNSASRDHFGRMGESSSSKIGFFVSAFVALVVDVAACGEGGADGG